MRRAILVLASFSSLGIGIGRSTDGSAVATANEKKANIPTPLPHINRAELTAALLAETNRVRRAHGRRALQGRTELDAAADDQAAVMVMTSTTSHISPIRGQRTPADRAARRGVDPAMVAENLAWYPVGNEAEPPPATEVAAALVEQWMNSPGHRANLLNPNFTQLGGSIRLARVLGQAWCAYGVQVFVVPRSRS
jgi:uncharacterized protein YkwD